MKKISYVYSVVLAVLIGAVTGFVLVRADEAQPAEPAVIPKLTDAEKIERYAPEIAKRQDLPKEKLLLLAERMCSIEAIKTDLEIRPDYPRTWGTYLEYLGWYFTHGSEFQDDTGVRYNIWEPRRGKVVGDITLGTAKKGGSVDETLQIKITGCACYRASEKDPWLYDYTSLGSETQKAIYTLY